MSEPCWGALCRRFLSQGLYDSARFYAERQYYDAPCPSHLHLLAQCYHRVGKVQQAYLVLKSAVFSDCQEAKYLFGQVCFELGKLAEAEQALIGEDAGMLMEEEITVESMLDTPGGAAGVYLLGKIYRRQQRLDLAKKSLVVALEASRTESR
jgi:tetratricopeptide (TPR) repeat protein